MDWESYIILITTVTSCFWKNSCWLPLPCWTFYLSS